ncbi:hypothetical protein IL252_14740 (plasmid) [Halomicrobium sp. IBSBa]|uniref:hypothetical protein n=1 Tax=Halomicrobium sp. IBSBa TaxID=2778916 RepID=UPI001ABF1A0D|nr:hypothetical protein [Halomicrobium sp. IBSBa]MBO4249074.1 hypothetical protein [Halomicrobium sp. IBSBa]
MERRAFLTTVGVGLTAVSGCLSAGSADSQATDFSTDTTRSTERDRFEGTLVETDETVERTVGTGTLEERGRRRPHRVAVTNSGDEPKQVTVSLERSGTTVLEEVFTLRSAATVGIAFTELGSYDLTVTVPAADATEAISLGPDRFTCNVTKTSIGIQGDGSLDVLSTSTRMACPGVVTERVSADAVASRTLGDDSTDEDPEETTHGVALRNESDRTWTARLLVDSDAGPLFDGAYTVAPGGRVRLTLAERGSYSVSFDVLETGGTATEPVPSSSFDCNESSTRATIDADGELSVSTMTTLVACPESTPDTTTNSSS